MLLRPNSWIVGDDGADKSLYLWSLEWWPWSARQWHNPLDVHVAWAPHGYDFGLGTASAALSFLAAPLTTAAGPVVSYNVLMLAAPALAATTCFLLAHRLTGRLAPSFAGGWIFGFSSYELGRVVGHLPLAFTALVPLVALLVVLRHEQAIGRRRFVALLALLLTTQYWIATQIFFSLAVVAALAAVLAVALLGRAAVGPAIADAALAWGLSLVVVAPALLYALSANAAAPARSPFSEAADVLNFVVPTRRTWVRPPGSAELAERFTGTGAEQGAYLGLPVLILGALAVLRAPRSRSRLFLGALFVGVAILATGTRVKVAGIVVGIGPWSAVASLPVVGSALPSRFTLFTALAAGVLVALALHDRSTPWRWALAVAAIVLTLPNLHLGQWSSPVPRTDVMTAARFRSAVAEDATVLVLPYGPAGWSLLWQAEAGFRVRLVGGHFSLRVTPGERPWRDVYENLGSGNVEPARLRAFLAAHRVDAVVVAPGASRSARRLVVAAAPRRPVAVGDGLVYRLRPSGG